jgi:hypothetical protein
MPGFVDILSAKNQSVISQVQVLTSLHATASLVYKSSTKNDGSAFKPSHLTAQGPDYITYGYKWARCPPLSLFTHSHTPTSSTTYAFTNLHASTTALKPSQLISPLTAFPQILINLWIESRESVFECTQITAAPAFTLCNLVIKSLAVILPFLISQPSENGERKKEVEEWCKMVHKHITPHFPFCNNVSCRDSTVASDIVDLNLIYASLLLHLYTHSPNAVALKAVEGFVLDFLDSKPVAHFLDMGLRVAKDLLRFSETCSALMFPALVRLQKAKSSTTGFTVFRMISSIIMAETEPKKWSEMDGSNHAKLVGEWILGLSKLIWQLKLKNVDYTREIIKFMTDLLKYRRIVETEETLMLSVIPLFATAVPSKTSGGESMMYGPFITFPVEIQNAMLEMVFYLPQWHEKLVRAVTLVAQGIIELTQKRRYLLRLYCM